MLLCMQEKSQLKSKSNSKQRKYKHLVIKLPLFSSDMSLLSLYEIIHICTAVVDVSEE